MSATKKKVSKGNVWKSLFFGFVAVLVVYFYFASTKTKASWFDDAWRYRVAIPISAHTSAETNVYITLSGSDGINTTDTTKFQADCGDIRFVNEAGDLLPYYLTTACGLSQTGFQVFFESFPAGAQTIYYYYGNPSAPNGFSSAIGSVATGVTLGTRGSEITAPSSPMVYLRLDEGAGQTVSNSMETVNNGTLGPDGTVTSTDPSWKSEELCVSGKCLEFESSSSQYANIANSIAGVKSVSFWVKPTSTTTSLLVLNGPTGNASLSVSSGTISAGAGFTSPTIYVNGKVSSTIAANQWQYVTVTTSTGITASNMVLGRVNTSYLDGFMDEVKLFGSVIDASQIKSGYTNILSRSSGIKNNAVSFGGGVAGGNLASGLVGYWKMDEAATPAVDSSGNGNNGTWTNTPAATTGKFGNGVYFDIATTNKYISVPAATSINDLSAFTISVWVNPAELQTNTGIFNKGSSINLYLENVSGGLRTQFNMACSGGWMDVFSTSTDNLTLNTWQNIVVTWDGTGCTTDSTNVYINGKLIAKHPNSASTTGTRNSDSSMNISIGNKTDALTTDQFQGSIDETRLYNRALTVAEISQLYNFAPGPVAYWKFDENIGQNLTYGLTGASTLGLDSSVASDDPVWSTGKYGGALQFDGTNDLVRTDDSNSFSFGNGTTDRPYTMEAWVYMENGYGISRYIMDKGSEWQVRVGGDGRLICTQDDTSAGALIGRNWSGPVQTGVWYHVACTYDGSSTSAGTKIYVNGIRVDNSNEASGTYTAMENTANSMRFSDGEFLRGKLDEVKIYNYSRTQSQIIEDMNAGSAVLSGVTGSSLLHLKFDEGYGDTAYDSGFGGNNGDLVTGATCPGGSAACPTRTINGKKGKALDFDGTDDYVFFGTDPVDFDITGDLTISTWVYVDTFGDGEFVVHKGETGSELEADNELFFLGWDTTSGNDIEYGHEYGAGTDEYKIFDVNLATSTWYQVTLVRNATLKTLKLYINGVLRQQTTYTNTPTGGTGGEMAIGSNDDASGNFLDGKVDEFKIYNSELTAEQVKLEYNSGLAQQLGYLSTDASNVPNMSSRDSYCPPGQGSTCISPVGIWKMDENNGTNAFDSSGNELSGTLANGSAWVTGKYGSGVSFDGIDDRITLPDSAIYGFDSANPSFTISGWFKTSVAGARQGLFGLSSGSDPWLSVFINTDNVVWVQSHDSVAANNSQSGTKVVTDGKWHYFAVVRDSLASKIYVYIDGASDINAADTRTGNFNGSTYRIGEDDSGYNMNGSMDNVLIYNYARSSAQISWDYNNGAPIGLWKFDECQGSTIYDSADITNTAAITIGASGTQSTVGTCAVNTTSARYTGREGKINAALNFDGTDDYAVRTGTALPTGDISISAWVYRNATNNAHTIVKASPGDGTNELKFAIMASDDGTNPNKLRFTVDGTSTYSQTALSSANTWYHVVGVRSGSTVRMYINGKLDPVSGSDGTALNFGSCNLFIGGSPGSGCSATLTEYFNGKIDDLRIYNYALNATQVSQIMNDGAVKLAPATGSPN